MNAAPARGAAPPTECGCANLAAARPGHDADRPAGGGHRRDRGSASRPDAEPGQRALARRLHRLPGCTRSPTSRSSPRASCSWSGSAAPGLTPKAGTGGSAGPAAGVLGLDRPGSQPMDSVPAHGRHLAGLPAQRQRRDAWLPVLWWASWLLAAFGQRQPWPHLSPGTGAASLCLLAASGAMLIAIIRVVSAARSAHRTHRDGRSGAGIRLAHDRSH